MHTYRLRVSGTLNYRIKRTSLSLCLSWSLIYVPFMWHSFLAVFLARLSGLSRVSLSLTSNYLGWIHLFWPLLRSWCYPRILPSVLWSSAPSHLFNCSQGDHHEFVLLLSALQGQVHLCTVVSRRLEPTFYVTGHLENLVKCLAQNNHTVSVCWASKFISTWTYLHLDVPPQTRSHYLPTQNPTLTAEFCIHPVTCTWFLTSLLSSLRTTKLLEVSVQFLQLSLKAIFLYPLSCPHPFPHSSSHCSSLFTPASLQSCLQILFPTLLQPM